MHGAAADIFLAQRRNMQVCEIYARHPEWDRGLRRLFGSLDHWNTRSWTRWVDTRKVDVAQAWAGWHARARFMATGLFKQCTSSILAPSPRRARLSDGADAHGSARLRAAPLALAAAGVDRGGGSEGHASHARVRCI